MKRSSSIESLVRHCAIHPWRTVGGWAVAIVLSLVFMAILLPDAITNDSGFIGTPVDSVKADQLLEDRLRGPEKVYDVVIVRSESLTVDDPVFRENVEDMTRDIVALGDDIVESAFNYYQLMDESFVSADGHTTRIPVVMAGDLDEAVSNVDQIRDIVNEVDGKDGLKVLMTGDATLNKDWMEMAQNDLRIAELFGIPVALLILIIVFGALVAAAVPLVLGILSIILALGVTAIIGQAWEFSVFITNMIFVMGLALGIDYSLFILSRYREERQRGAEKIDAITVSGATASRAVFFSGMTVVFALCGMLIVPTSIFVSIASGAILVAIAAVMGSLTLLPAILSLLGDKIDRLRVPWVGRRSIHRDPESEGGFWDWISRRVMYRPVVSLLLAIVVLVAIAFPAMDVNLGAAGISTLPDSMESKRGFEVLEEDFSWGLISPAEIVIDGPINTEAVQTGILRLEDLLKSDPSYFGDPVLEVNPDGDLALLSAALSGDPNDDETMDAAERLRDEYIPEAFAGVDAQVLVTGWAASNVDYIDISNRYLPIVIVFVLGLSFMLLMMVFRSIIIPPKAILMNLLSVGAAYGLVVLVFQKGVGADMFGFVELDTFEAWVPIFLFCVLFGLSMDYHVFLLSRIRERFDHTSDNNEAVAFGLRSTGSIITGAALIMVVVFGAFAAGDLVMFQQMGFGLAVAIFIDATIIRSILVPSAMRLLGRINWYLPGFLKWIPSVNIGESSVERKQ